jgi:Leucine-rich repeat (LRR) protein
MSQTGVLPFVRGIDFTRYGFEEESKHPKLLSEMQRLRWIRMNHTGIKALPEEITSLKKLEQLHVANNKLTRLDRSLVDLSCLRVINARHNRIKSNNVPNDLYKLEDLAVLVSSLRTN